MINALRPNKSTYIVSAPIIDMSVTSRLKNWRTSPPKGLADKLAT